MWVVGGQEGRQQAMPNQRFHQAGQAARQAGGRLVRFLIERNANECKYHANKLLPGGSGLGAEGEGRGLLSRGPPPSPFLFLGCPRPCPPTPWCCPPNQAITFWEQWALHPPPQELPDLLPNPVAPDGGDRMLKEEPANLWMGLA